MAQIATGPNGRPLIALSPNQSASEARQARTFLNGQHDEADRRPEVRDRIKREEMPVEAVKRDPKGITVRWDVPREIPQGPHKGKWCIHVPADETRRHQRDPRTGDTVERPAPEWAGAEIVEDDPAWWSKDARV